MVPASDRLQAFTEKYVAATIGLKVAARLTGMKTEFAGAAAYFAALELQTQGILNGAGVCGISRAGYYNFVREIAGKQFRGSAGAGLKADAVIIETKWVAFGYDDGILKGIALDVFGITIP